MNKKYRKSSYTLYVHRTPVEGQSNFTPITFQNITLINAPKQRSKTQLYTNNKLNYYFCKPVFLAVVKLPVFIIQHIGMHKVKILHAARHSDISSFITVANFTFLQLPVQTYLSVTIIPPGKPAPMF
jgi:hypothetical protein